ncbi:MAG: PadR family transcriptional regulator [Anaerolineales bacterium]|nr:PadR family transcriptional regulator [Anaerolineales bacterium]MCL4260524.1 PadR family transcriptional regulator [Anaerolineales bacterium]
MSVRNAILGLLAKKPRHGYELRVAFSAVVGDVSWDVKPAQIYTTLDRLEESGLVQTKSDIGEGREPDRRIYAITRDGRNALKEWFVSSIPSEHQRDEFYVKLMISLISGEADPAKIIQTQRTRLYQELHDATAQRDHYDAQSELAKIFLSDKVIMHLEADLRWLDMIEMRIESIKKQPLDEVEVRRRGRPRKGDKGSTYPPPS